MIHSDWHTHTVASPDGALTVEAMCEAARAQGLRHIGMSDHYNYADDVYGETLRRSRALYEQYREKYPELRFGIELSPVPKPVTEALAAGIKLPKSRAGYIAPGTGPYEPSVAMTAQDVEKWGLDYVIIGVHWRCDAPDAAVAPESPEKWIAEWLRMMTWSAGKLAEIAGDRLKILAHPWYSCIRSPWYQSPGENNVGFSLIPYSAHEELAAALKQYGVAAECNADQVVHPILSERYRREYAEFLRFLYERGVKISYGTDEHSVYNDRREAVLQALAKVGFGENDLI